MNKKILVVGSVAALLMGSSAVYAHETSLGGNIAIEGDALTGIVGSSGNAVLTGLGECLQTGSWSEDNTNDACQGVEAAEPEPEPEPVVEKAPEPEPEPPKVVVTTANLSGQAFFDTDSDSLTGQGESALANLLLEIEALQEVTEIAVTGHTDSRGSEAYNQALSERRAATVAAYLQARYPNVAISTTGLGETVPRETNSTGQGRQANRRVGIQVTGQVVNQN